MSDDVEMTLSLIASMLHDLYFYLDEGDYNGVKVVKEDGEPYIIYRSMRFKLPYIEVEDLKKIGLDLAIDLLYRLARSAILKHGRNVEGWLFLDEGASAEDWFFFMKPNSRVVYAMIYETALNDRIFYKITRRSIEELKIEKLKTLFGNKVFKIFPTLFAEDVDYPEALFIDKEIDTRIEPIADLHRDLQVFIDKIARAYVEKLKSNIDALRKWLSGIPVAVAIPANLAPDLHRICFMLPTIRCYIAFDGVHYIYISPEVIANKFPDLFEELKKTAGMETTVVDIIKKLKMTRVDEPIPLDTFSKMIGVDIKQYLPFLVDEGYIYIFRIRNRPYVMTA